MPNFEVPTHLGFTGPAIVVSAFDKAGLQMLVENIANALAPELPEGGSMVSPSVHGNEINCN